MGLGPGPTRIPLFLLILCCLLLEINSIFCSAYCKPNSCTGPAATQCTACDPPFLHQANNSCTVDPTSNYIMFADSTQITNVQGGSSSCGGYTFNGQYSFNDQIWLRSDNPITAPHYAVRVISWVILYNEWSLTNDYMIGSINTSSQVVRVNVNTYSTAQLLCSWSTANEWYLKLDMEFLHTDLARVRIMLDTTDVQQEPWGIKEYMFLLAKCHVACDVCFDATVLNCSACATGYKLSGTVCNESCLYKYGQTSNATICVACDPYCTACYLSATNCSACQTNGTYQSFLNASSCVTNCPTKFTEKTSTHTCIPCTSSLCDVCNVDGPSICTQCQAGSFWFNFTCLASCPGGYFPTSPNCTQCDVSCTVCSGVPTPCTACANNYFLYTNQCPSTCPTGYFGHRALRQCLDCPTYCVTASISMGLSSDNRKLTIKITFSRQIDWSSFPYKDLHILITNDSTLDLQSKFTTTISPVDSQSYQLELTPKPTINMSCTNFSVTLKPKSQDLYSRDGYLFNDNVYLLADWELWTLIVYPEMTGDQQAFVQKFQGFNQGVNQAFGGQFVQEIKKTGIFGLLFPGAQLCSTIILHNSVPAQNFYEGARFWANFIYFQVPKWQKGPNLTKYLVKPAVSELVGSTSLSSSSSHLSSPSLQPHRILQAPSTSSAQNWRFLRTGHTQFFIFDTYFLLALLLLSWALLLIPRLCRRKLSPNKRSIFYNALHKVHEVSLFYITISVILEWITFADKKGSASFQGNYGYVYASFGASLAASLYYLIYEVYIFYRLIPFGHVRAGSTKYLNYVEKYSYYLRDIRYQEYRRDMAWTPRHFLRPYNYQILSCIRLILLVSALPIFHEYPSASITCMLIVQFFEVIRFILTWPYHAAWRNITKLILEITLLAIFSIFMSLYIMVTHIYQNLNTVTDAYLKLYYVLGWTGMVLIFVYNILFIGLQIGELVTGCRYTNQERIDNSRQEYYYQILNQFQDTAMVKLGISDGRPGKIEDNLDGYGEIDYRDINAVQRAYGNSKDVIKKSVKEKETENAEKKDKEKELTTTLNRQIWRRLRRELRINADQANQEFEELQEQQEQLERLERKKGTSFLHFVTTLHGGEYNLYYPKSNGVKNRRRAIQEIIKCGNLNNECYGEYKKTQIKIEQLQVRYTQKQKLYEVKIYKVPGIFMRKQIDPRNPTNENLLIPQKTLKTIKLLESLNREYFIIIDTLFKNYASVSTEYVIIRTFLAVDLNLYEPNQEIPQSVENLSQWVQVKEYNGSLAKEKLEELLPMFPVPNEVIEKL